MKRLVFVAILAAMAFAVSAVELPQVGSIDYAEGGVSIGRSGKIIAAPDIGDPILAGDLIKTQGDGMVVIALEPDSTGMAGKITVKPRSTLYFNLATIKGEPRSEIQLLTGAIGSKVNKLAGTPTLNVVSSSATMAVRGTSFEVVISINASDSGALSLQATLVICTESKVAVNDGREEIEVPEGRVLEKRPGERPRFLPVAISSLEGFSQRWMTDEIAAFRADAPRALASYAKRYAELSARFAAAYEPFQKSATPRKWAEEDRAGTEIDPLDPTVMREKKEVAGYLLNIRKVLFLFERVYYRVDEISDAISGTADERREIKPKVTAGDFLRSVRADRDRLAAQVARYRYVESLYKQRSPDGDVFSQEDDSFFASPDGF